jgi:phage minor structural protein GP20
MEFLKALFGNGEALTYEQLVDKVNKNKLNIVNLADGSYVSKAKFDDRVSTLSQQIAGLQGQIAQRDQDIQGLNDKLTAAKADTTKLAEAQSTLATLQSQYETDRQTWEAKAKQQEYDFRIREKAGALNFSSPAAKRDFIREASSKEFKLDGDTLLGYEDFLTKYKTENPGALIEDKPADVPPADPQVPPAPAIVLPKTQTPEPEKSVFGFHFNGVRPKPSEN